MPRALCPTSNDPRTISKPVPALTGNRRSSRGTYGNDDHHQQRAGGWRMSGRAIIIIVVGIIVVSGIILYNIEAASISITQNVNRFYSGREAQNIAQSGVNVALGQLASDREWRTGFPSMNLLGGKVSVTVSDSTWYGRKVIKIVSEGIMNYGTASEERDTSIAYLPQGLYPPAMQGLI